MKKIYSELARIQRELRAPKNLYNKFGNYSYRNAEGILEAVKPLLNGLVLVIDDCPVIVGDRYYIQATATLTDGEESISATAYAREDETKKGMDGCQITGACSSYARKYALNALLMIDDSKDSDDDSLSPRNPANETTVPPRNNPPVQVAPRNMPTAATVTPMAALPPITPVLKAETNGPEISPVKTYLAAQLVAMCENRGITNAENNKLFKKQLEALVKAGLAPDKKIDDYTIEEAEALVDAMNKCFEPTGTELKTQ